MSPDPSTSSRTQAPSSNDFAVEFPEGRERLEQDQEWCTLSRKGDRERLRFHDYGRIYEVPGLYEHLFYTRLECESPQMVRSRAFWTRAARASITSRSRSWTSRRASRESARTVDGSSTPSRASGCTERASHSCIHPLLAGY